MRGVTSPGPGAVSTVEILMPITSPSLAISEEVATPGLVSNSVSQTAFAVDLIDPFSEANGVILYYAIIVRRKEVVVRATPLPTWAQARSQGNSYYQVTLHID